MMRSTLYSLAAAAAVALGLVTTVAGVAALAAASDLATDSPGVSLLKAAQLTTSSFGAQVTSSL